MLHLGICLLAANLALRIGYVQPASTRTIVDMLLAGGVLFCANLFVPGTDFGESLDPSFERPGR